MADLITIVCRKCKSKISVPEHLAMMFVQCPTCEDRILVPHAGTAPTPDDEPVAMLPAAQVLSRQPAISVQAEPYESTDTAGILGLMFGVLALGLAIAGFLSGGYGYVFYTAAIILMFSGGSLSFFGQEALKIAGLALNGLSLAMVVILALAGGMSDGDGSPEAKRPPIATTSGDPSTSATLPVLPTPEPPTSATPPLLTESPKVAVKPGPRAAGDAARQALVAQLQPGRAWKVSLPSPNGSIQEYRFTVGRANEKGATVTMLAERVDEPFERAVLEGKLESGASSGPQFSRPAAYTQNWHLAMRPGTSAGRLNSLASTPIVIFVPAEQTEIAFGFSGERYAATAAEANEVDADAAGAKFQAALAPGVRWLGKGEIGGKPSAEVTLTCMEWRDEGRYIRLVAESKEDPSLAAVYEGSLATQGAKSFLWPVQLQKSDSAFRGGSDPLLAEGTRALELDLTAEGMLAGLVGNQRLRLKRAPEPIKVEGFADRVKQTITPGTRWPGKITAGANVGSELELIVTDVRGDGAVRAVVTMPEEPAGVAVYTGQLQLDDANINGCFVALKQVHREGPDGFFGGAGGKTAELSLRLAADGSRIYGRTSDREGMSLQREIQDFPAAGIAKEARTAAIKEALAKGTTWAGKLTNRRFGQAVDITLKGDVVATPGDTVQVSVSTTNKGRTTRVAFDGRVLFDDEHIEGYAVQLKKSSSGKVNGSPVFSAELNSKLLLRLSLDAETLYGLAAAAGATSYDEVLVLKRKEAAKN